MPKKPVTTEAYSLAEAQSTASQIRGRGGVAVIENSLKPGLYVVRSDRPGYPLKLRRNVATVRAHPREGTRGVRSHYRRTVSKLDKQRLDETIESLEMQAANSIDETVPRRQANALKRIRDFVWSWS